MSAKERVIGSLRRSARRLPAPVRREGARLLARRRDLVSVVVTVTDTQTEFLDQCLDSLRSQDHTSLQVIVVAHGPGSRALEVTDRHARADWRVRVGKRGQGGLAAARNAGAASATGDFLVFVDGGDTVPPGGIGALARALNRSGSDFAVGRVRSNSEETTLVLNLHSQGRQRTTIRESPEALAETTVEGRMFRLSFWRALTLQFPDTDGQVDRLPVVTACVRADSFDVVAETVYSSTGRGDGLPFGHMRDHRPMLPAWAQSNAEVARVLGGLDLPDAYDAWLVGVLATDVPTFAGDAERMDPATWTLFRQSVEELVGNRFTAVQTELRLESRVQAWLVTHDRRSELEEFVASQWFAPGRTTVVEDGRVYARLPFFGDPRVGIPDDCYLLTETETPLRGSLRGIRWQGSTLYMSLFAFIEYVDLRDAAPSTTAALVDARTGERLELGVEQSSDRWVNRYAAHPNQDYSAAALVVAVDTRLLVEGADGAGREWVLELTSSTLGVTRTGRVRHRDRSGSAGKLEKHRSGEFLAGLRLDPGTGLVVTTEPATEPPVSTVPAAALVVNEVSLRAGQLVVTTGWAGEEPATWSLELFDDELVTTGRVEAGVDQRLVSIPLQVDRWGLGETALPVGTYRLRVVVEGSSAVSVTPVLPGEDLLQRMPSEQCDDRFRMRTQRTPQGGLAIRLSAPLRDDEVSAFDQRVLQEWYRAGSFELDERAVYFQSYTGQSATDSPLAIHHELRRRHPELVHYWGVSDSASELPEGAMPVLIRSREWYQVLARAKYLVSNINLDRWFEKRAGQRVLQTFHGYPSKVMGLSLWEAKAFTPRRIAVQLASSSRDWDMILTPVPEMDEHYRREYSYDGEILNRGYPRDDLLVSAPTALREDVRRRLGITGDQTAVLYAPTWRDDLATNFRKAVATDFLDLDEARSALGRDFVLLMRGHRFHDRRKASALGASIIDVSDYPEINDLVLAADVAVLDYSSLRFDFALTGKPMLFLVPDLGRYTQGVRGFLFSFEESAPGPLLTSTQQVVGHLQDLDAVRSGYAERLAEFVDTYQYTQDGHASERAVRAFFGPGTP